MAKEQPSGVYCIDTSSLIDLYRWRPPKKQRQPWRHLEGLIDQQRLIAPREVLRELAEHGRDDDLLEWARDHKRMFKPSASPEIVQTVKEILREFPTLVDPDRLEAADPFVVALALKQKASDLFEGVTVITEEKYGTGKSRIPHVCEEYKLMYLQIHQMFLAEGWSL